MVGLKKDTDYSRDGIRVVNSWKIEGGYGRMAEGLEGLEEGVVLEDS
jgi:hypothetical protein